MEKTLVMPNVADSRATEDNFVLPTSFAQESLWFIDQLVPGIPLYNVPMAARVLGKLDAAVLERSLAQIAQRHEILRTTFRAIDGQPMQVIAPTSNVTLELTDLSMLEPAERVSEKKRLIDQEGSRPFDLALGPLMRAKLLRMAEEEHVLITSRHHIVTDDWSERLFMQELVNIYQALIEGQEPVLPELTIQYADFAQWQRDYLQGEVFESQTAYWRESLAGAPDLQLPTDRRRPLAPTYNAATESIEFSTELSTYVKALARQERVTLFTLLLAAFKVLLARYAGQEDITVGSPFAYRHHSQTESLIGYFINPLPLRTKLDGGLTFRETLRLVHETALGAHQRQDVPFEILVEELAPERSPGRNPLFQTMFVMVNARPNTYRSRDLTMVPIEVGERTAKFDLTLFLSNSAQEIRGSLVYSVDLFEAATIRRMADHFRQLVSGIVANPDARIFELPLLTRPEKEQILIDWNQTQSAFPADASIDQLFAEQVGKTPDAIAIECGDTQWSYRELDQRANQLAQILRQTGVTPETLVGLFLDRSPELFAGMLAILKVGGAYVPIDPAYPAERRAVMLAPVPIVITTKRYSNAFSVGSARVIYVEDIATCPAAISATQFERLSHPSTGDSIAYVIYTSGSTGKPKGVMVPHRGVIRLFRGSNFLNIGPADVVAQTLNPCFDASVQEIWGALLHGARLVILDNEVLLSPRRFKQALQEYKITAWMTTTALFNLMAHEVPEAFAKLTYVVFGGEAADPKSVSRVLQHGAPTHLFNAYGPTEASVVTTCLDIKNLENEAISVSIGRPISNTTVYLLDQFGTAVPIGVVGELYIGGPGVAHGYVNAPELTSERFVVNPFSEEPGARLYRTGDLARWLPDGTIEFVGRTDHQIKIRGFRIELGEIEAVLKQHPAVVQATVVLGEDNGEKRLLAYAAGDLSKLTEESVRTFLTQKLPDYMLPSAIVTMEELPFDANGKIDRRALPEALRIDPGKETVAPRDALEAQLLAIWQKALELTTFGVTDNFFELGGHSLLAVRIFSEIERCLGRKLPVATFFQAPTVEALANVLRQQTQEKRLSALVAIQPFGSRPPFFNVHDGYGSAIYYGLLAGRLGPEQPFYGFLARNKDGAVLQLTSIETIAEYYIDEMLQVRPVGPYYLGGFCLGGVIAFEMARQLHAAGQQVALLILFDTDNPAMPRRRYTMWERLRQHTLLLKNTSLRQKLQTTVGRVKSHANRWRKSLLKQASIGRQPSLYEIFGTERILHRAQAAYRPQPYPGKVTLILPENDFEGYELLPDRGWTELSDGGIEIHHIPGGHGSMFKRPYVDYLADRVTTCLRTAFEQTTQNC
jgi:amino acid adenylation domain-containing protein